MALSHDGYNFESAKHGAVEYGELETPLIVAEFNGVVGVSVIADEPKGQLLRCRAWIDGYASLTLVQDAVDAIQAKQGTLTGTLTVTGGAADTIERCTFSKFTPERPFLDGSGVHGWVCRGILAWIRRG